jgi:hypothetical protein
VVSGSAWFSSVTTFELGLTTGMAFPMGNNVTGDVVAAAVLQIFGTAIVNVTHRCRAELSFHRLEKVLNLGSQIL